MRDQLLAAIERGELQPGDRLPSESEMSSTFGVSRVSVRLALSMLETMGLVEIRHGRGSFVAHGPGQSYFGPFASWLHVYRDEISDLMKVRGALDELAAAEAAATTDRSALDQVVATERAFSEAAKDATSSVDSLAHLDIEFHNSVAKASNSSLLPHLLADLNELFTEARRAAFSIDGLARRSAGEHAEIVRAILSGDAVAARAAAAQHLESARNSLGDPDFLTKLAANEPAAASGAGPDVLAAHTKEASP